MSSYLRGKILDDKGANFFEEKSLEAIHRSLYAKLQIADVFLLIDEMPKIVTLNYPIVEQILGGLIKIVEELIKFLRTNSLRHEEVNMGRTLNYLKTFDTLKKRTN